MAPEDNAKPGRGSVEMAPLRQFLTSINSAVGPDMILSPGKELFHYTDLNGIIGILSNGDLWLTHALYLNDDEEIAHGQRVAQNAVAGAIQQSAADPQKSAYLSELKSLIDRPSTEGVYVCCFCRKDNLLSQWRGYAANGSGVSLQFDSAGFGQWTGDDCMHGLMRFWKVFYNPDQQRKIVDGAISFAWNTSTGLPPAQIAQRAADAIQFFIPTFKNTDFSEEDEWRLIFTPNPICPIPPRFRTRGAMLVPYYSLRDLGAPAPPPPLPPPLLPIQHVTIGPNPVKSLNLASVRMILNRYGYPAVPVEASKTSFRG